MGIYQDKNNFRKVGESKGPRVTSGGKPIKTEKIIGIKNIIKNQSVDTGDRNVGSIFMEGNGIVTPVIEVHDSYEKLSSGEKVSILLKLQKWVNKELSDEIGDRW